MIKKGKVYSSDKVDISLSPLSVGGAAIYIREKTEGQQLKKGLIYKSNALGVYVYSNAKKGVTVFVREKPSKKIKK